MHKARILVADDDAVNLRLLLALLEKAGCEVITARDGGEAWSLIRNSSPLFDVVILDRKMPGMDGLEILKRMKEVPGLRYLPVILQTGMGERDQILEGIQAGALYYAPKPLDPELFSSVVDSAIQVSTNTRGLQHEVHSFVQSLPLLHSAQFKFRTLQEAQFLAHLLATACPDPERTVVGLTELLVNAVEHGNLELGYEGKTKCLHDLTLRQEIERRLELPDYKNRKARVFLERKPWGLLLTIQDEGPGFDWRTYWDLDQTRVFDTHGRGIPMARNMSFDGLAYVGNGNTVVATVLFPN